MGREKKSGFLYFVPGVRKVEQEELAGLGLGHLRGLGLPQCVCNRGPKGEPGVVFALGDGPHPMYQPKGQTWRPVLDGKVWIGWESAFKPTVKDLRRKKQIVGADVLMSDGAHWHIPRARLFPWVYDYDESGAQITQVQASFRALWDRAGELRRRYVTPSEVAKYSELCSVVAEAIAINYCVGEPELILIGAMGQDGIEDAFEVVTALDELRAAYDALGESEKKTDDASTP